MKKIFKEKPFEKTSTSNKVNLRCFIRMMQDLNGEEFLLSPGLCLESAVSSWQKIAIDSAIPVTYRFPSCDDVAAAVS